MRYSRRIFTVSVMAVALSAFPCGAQAAQTDRSLEEAFDKPPMEARPRTRWWWPGAAVTDSELTREIELFDRVGFGGAEIQAFKPGVPNLTSDELAVVDDYASPAFFDHVRTAAAAAHVRGLTIDYTLGSAWPSGGGLAITPEKAMLELTMATTTVKGGTSKPIKVDLPKRFRRLSGAMGFFGATAATSDWPKRLDARGKTVAVIAVRGTAPRFLPSPTQGVRMYPWERVETPGRIDSKSTLILTDRLGKDGILDWSPPAGEWQVVVLQQYAADTAVTGVAGKGPQLVLDHMNKAAFEAHAKRVGDPLTTASGRAMKGLRSTFVDSFELFQDLPWTEDFLTQFRVRRGYDLTPYLPLVVQPSWHESWGGAGSSQPYFEAAGSLGERVRADYRQTVSDLMYEGFVAPFVAWNHARGLKAKLQAHGGPHDVIKAYGAADIPEVESLGGVDPLSMRQGRSAANIYGRKIISSESLGLAGRPYSPTPDELRRLADVNFAGGVNSLIYHGYTYRRAHEKWPGWHAFQPTAFGPGFGSMISEGNPIWAGVPRLNSYVARTQAVLQQGEPIVPIAYFLDALGSYRPGDEHGSGGPSGTERALMAGGYDFDRINPDGLLRSRAANGALLTPGGTRYGALLVPQVEGIKAEAAEKIAVMARAGVTVVFTDRVPQRDVTLKDRDQRDRRVKAAIASALSSGAIISPNGDIVETLRRRQMRGNLRFTAQQRDGLAFVQRRVGARTVTFLANTADASRDATMVLPGRGGVSRWDAMDGTREPVSSRSGPDGVTVPITLAAGESILLVQDPGTAPGPQPSRRIVSTLALPTRGWALRVDGHGSNATAVHRDFGQVALGDWSGRSELTRFSGRGAYHRQLVLPPGWRQGNSRVFLNLGQVHDMATVTINGRTLPAAITAPFRVDLTSALRDGANDLTITVYNTPNNAMISPAGAFKTLKPVPAGLVGPVILELEILTN